MTYIYLLLPLPLTCMLMFSTELRCQIQILISINLTLQTILRRERYKIHRTTIILTLGDYQLSAFVHMFNTLLLSYIT